jgi:hypothetical protein
VLIGFGSRRGFAIPFGCSDFVSLIITGTYLCAIHMPKCRGFAFNSFHLPADDGFLYF